jgi:RNA polymerase sigma-70 factor (ECF subfamily)
VTITVERLQGRPDDAPAPVAGPSAAQPVCLSAPEALADRARQGDRAALRGLLVAVSPVVARACRRVLGDRHPDLDDVAQQALTGFVQRLRFFRGDSSIAHFAERIAVYRALTCRRDAGVRLRMTVPVAPDELETAPDGGPGPDAQVAASRARALLLAAMDSLPRPQAEVLALHFLFDHTVAEIAAMADCPEETVRSRLRLGKKALRARISEDSRLASLREVLT